MNMLMLKLIGYQLTCRSIYLVINLPGYKFTRLSIYLDINNWISIYLNINILDISLPRYQFI